MFFSGRNAFIFMIGLSLRLFDEARPAVGADSFADDSIFCAFSILLSREDFDTDSFPVLRFELWWWVWALFSPLVIWL